MSALAWRYDCYDINDSSKFKTLKRIELAKTQVDESGDIEDLYRGLADQGEDSMPGQRT
jgi:hypothetical protein